MTVDESSVTGMAELSEALSGLFGIFRAVIARGEPSSAAPFSTASMRKFAVVVKSDLSPSP